MIGKTLATVWPTAGVVLDLVQRAHMSLIPRDRHHLTAVIHWTLSHALVTKLLVIEQVLSKLGAEITFLKRTGVVSLFVHYPNVICQVVACLADFVAKVTSQVLLFVCLFYVLL